MNEQDPLQGSQDVHAYRVAYLLSGYIQQKLTEAEEVELDDWVGESMANQRLFEELTDPKNFESYQKWKEKLPTAAVLDRLKSKLAFSDVPKKQSILHSFLPYAAAAVIIVGIIAAIKWFPSNNPPKDISSSVVKDIKAGSNKATLTLADGKLLLLDTAVTGHMTSQGNASIEKEDSALISYHSTDTVATRETVTHNTISTPNGGNYSLILSDGSKVMLNASSTLQFPTAFTGKRRAVVLTGEGYFEIAKNPNMPFEVQTVGNTITVLGTHFNVNAYTDEPAVKVTLEEGSVRLNNTHVLKPGEQAQISAVYPTKIVPADIDKELGWKNGEFVFKSSTLEEIMRQVARWYDCAIVFHTNNQDHFNATVSRKLPVSHLLHFLEGTGRVHFVIEDKKITVMP